MHKHIVLAVAACVAMSATAADAADADANVEARRHFKAGVALLEDPEGERFEEAYAAFRAAYELSKSPTVLGNLGLCAMKLERDGEAIDAYTRYLREVSDIDSEERLQVSRDLQTLSSSAVRVSVTVPSADAMLIDTRVPVRGSSVRNVYVAVGGKAELLVRPGHHVLTARVAGKDLEPWEFTAMGGARMAHAFTHPPAQPTVMPSSPSSSRPVAPWILVGIGGVVAATGLVTGIVALNKTNSVSDACPNEQCATPAAKDELRSATTFATATDALLVGGAVLAAVGVGWLVFAPTKPTSSRASTVRVGGICQQAGCFGTAGGSF